MASKASRASSRSSAGVSRESWSRVISAVSRRSRTSGSVGSEASQAYVGRSRPAGWPTGFSPSGTPTTSGMYEPSWWIRPSSITGPAFCVIQTSRSPGSASFTGPPNSPSFPDTSVLTYTNWSPVTVRSPPFPAARAIRSSSTAAPRVPVALEPVAEADGAGALSWPVTARVVSSTPPRASPAAGSRTAGRRRRGRGRAVARSPSWSIRRIRVSLWWR